MTTAEASAALLAEIKQVRELVCANVPVQSMWLNRRGEVWTVLHRTADGIVVLYRRGVAKHGMARQLLLGGYRRI